MKRIPFPPLEDAPAPLPREGEVGGCHSRRGRHKTPRNAPGGMEASNERGRHGHIFANVERRDQRSGRSWRLSRSRRWLTFLVGQFIDILPSLVFFSRLSPYFLLLGSQHRVFALRLSLRPSASLRPLAPTPTPTPTPPPLSLEAPLRAPASAPSRSLRRVAAAVGPASPPTLFWVLARSPGKPGGVWSARVASIPLRPSVRCCCPGPTSSSLGRRRFPLASEAAAQQRETSAAASRVEKSRSRIV